MQYKSTLSLLIAGSLLAAACSGAPAKSDAPVETPTEEATEAIERGISPFAPLEYRDGDAEVVDLGEEEAIVVSSAFGVEHRVGSPIASFFHHRV
ncbi:MAG: hypothetical protein ACNA8W_19590, partial [Bradymonadaceae bacterium]